MMSRDEEDNTAAPSTGNQTWMLRKPSAYNVQYVIKTLEQCVPCIDIEDPQLDVQNLERRL